MLSDIIRWDPLGDVGSLRAEIDRLVGQAATGALPHRWAPSSDIIEGEDGIVITAELPGVKDEDIHITVQNGVLRISGERRLEEEINQQRFHRLERTYGGFERRFTLPQGIREEDIHAGVAYGVLKITIPKASAPEPRVVAVGSGD
jgi:HSP20 family protein